MIAFFCATPYQILIATQIKKRIFNDLEANIYILNHFVDSHIVAKNLAAQNIFNNVKAVNNSLEFTNSLSQKSRKRHFQKILSYYRYKKNAELFFEIKDQVYDHVFFSYADVIIQIGLKRILRNNKNCKVHLFEDGVGGYLNFGTNTSQKKKLFNYLTFSNGLENYADIYAFAPELMYNTTLPVLKIPKIDKKDADFLKQLNKIFNFDGNKITDQFVILEQPLSFRPFIHEIQLSTFNEIKPYSHILKIHPRSNSELYKDFNIFDNSIVPWEIVCLNSDLKNHVLISFYSTAAITNKLIFDAETAIIFLYDMEEFKEHFQLSSELISFFKSFQQSYSSPEKIFFPKTTEEFKEVLKLLHT